MKADDYAAIPLCHHCHSEYHQHGGLGFMTGAQTRDWALMVAWRVCSGRLEKSRG